MNAMASAQMDRRTFLKKTMQTTAAVALASLKGRKSLPIPAWFELTTWDVTVPGLGKAFEGYRLLHLTDIHQSEWMSTSKLTALKDFVLGSGVDVVVITGDSTYHTTNYQPLLDFYTGLAAQTPVLMTWGNHDIWDDAATGLQPILSNNVRLLSNERWLIERAGDRLCIAGLGCAYEELDDLASVIDEFPKDTPAIMLAHEPDVADAVAETGKFFLQLSGHSHGGQICLPNGYAPILPWLGQRYPRGYYDVNGMMLYTSRGLGRGKPFIRTYCPGEAEIFTLRCGDRPSFEPTQNDSIMKEESL